MTTVFIDGQAGTTGLQITERLQSRKDLELVYLRDEERKDPARRQACLQEADVSILCLPDEAAREAVALAEDKGRIIDASTAHRVAAGWDYGLPELGTAAREALRQSTRVSNPGCYPQGFILLLSPLIESGLLDKSTLLRCHALSGYSGGGRSMIEQRQAFSPQQAEALNSQVYGLTLAHKHVPEMQKYTGIDHPPIFSPTVAHYYQGMLVQIPLFRDELNESTPSEVHACLADRYIDEPFIEVLPLGLDMTDDGFLNPTACNGTNKVQLMVFASKTQYLLVARYDNLGKGAAGAAVQNLNLMLGIDETLAL